MDTLNRWITTVLLSAMVGCSGVVILDDEPLPSTASGLREYIASQESAVAAIRDEMDSAKEARDTMIEASKNASGYFAQSEAMKRVSRANQKIEFVHWRLTHFESKLAAAKAKLADLGGEEERGD